jgi:predicted acetyltransferase
MDFKDLYDTLYPNFFNQEFVKKLPAEEKFDELVFELKDFSENDLDIPVQGEFRYDFWKEDISNKTLQDAIKSVDEDWVQFFNDKVKDRIYCAFDGDKIASFCIVDSFGTYKDLNVGGPGCVGTVPEYRKKGIGLKVVQKATEILKNEGYGLSFIHWTKVASWYQKLGYKLILNWDSKGFN